VAADVTFLSIVGAIIIGAIVIVALIIGLIVRIVRGRPPRD
jgi:hypothetical protein